MEKIKLDNLRKRYKFFDLIFVYYPMVKLHLKYFKLGFLVFIVFANLIFFSMKARGDTVLIFAAASLYPVLKNINLAFQTKLKLPIKFSFGSSSSLANQIVRGAPSDIFISANIPWMDYAEKNSAIIATSRRTLMSNQIVLAAHKTSKESIAILTPRILKNLLDNHLLALGDPSHVPAGIYGKQALETMGLWEAVKNRLAPAANVRAALALVERNETPIGLLYHTDVLNNESVKVIFTFPDASHDRVEYVAAIVQGKARPAVQVVYEFLLGAKAKSIFSKYGFEVF